MSEIPQTLKDFLNKLDIDEFNEVASYAMSDNLSMHMGDIAYDRGMRWSEQQERYIYLDD